MTSELYTRALAQVDWDYELLRSHPVGWDENELDELIGAAISNNRTLKVVLELHRPVDSSFIRYGNPVLVCFSCGFMCHSSSGLMCEVPDGEFPCYEAKLLIKAVFPGLTTMEEDAK